MSASLGRLAPVSLGRFEGRKIGWLSPFFVWVGGSGAGCWLQGLALQPEMHLAVNASGITQILRARRLKVALSPEPESLAANFRRLEYLARSGFRAKVSGVGGLHAGWPAPQSLLKGFGTRARKCEHHDPACELRQNRQAWGRAARLLRRCHLLPLEALGS